MGNVNKYKIDYDWKAELIVEIDSDKIDDNGFAEINNFWSDADYRKRNHGCDKNAVLTMLAKVCIPMAYEQGLSIDGLIRTFDWDKGYGVEGWPPMNGSHGIKIVGIDTYGLFDSDDITISTVTDFTKTVNN
ncbi:DUF2528 family protein [Rosenbergiella collisarenosi]|uniref:DUF2528 family protein n=1 Tax=Rosenbergiella collisarenosi TaxID=1544695 RepID=UPI001BDA620A|nr:DUF2528 family protein [Rosenbergiella collisarenosi]MBT0720414.1 DUF2528 family protein [Rosenbergiella collisarenosi]